MKQSSALGNGPNSEGIKPKSSFKEFYQTSEAFLSNMEPTNEEKGQLLEKVFGVQFDSFDIRKQQEKKFYPECNNKLSGFCGTVTYQRKKYLLLDGVIILGDDGDDVGWTVKFQGNGECCGYANIESFDDAINTYQRRSGHLSSLDNSTETEFLHEQGLGCYKHHEGGLLFRSLFYNSPNNFGDRYIIPDSYYKKRKEEGCNEEILKFLGNVFIRDLVKIKRYQKITT